MPRRTRPAEPVSGVSRDASLSGTKDVTQVEQLCVDVNRAAEILGGISPWTVRALIADGHLATVKIPGTRRGETSRRVLISFEDLKVFVDKHREVGSG